MPSVPWALRLSLPILFLVIGTALTPLPAAQAQTALPATTAVIDGSVTPELIPDSAAYRLYFTALTHMSPRVRDVALTDAGLNPAERAAANVLVAKFKSDWNTLLNSRNQALAAGQDGGATGEAEFLKQRDALVANMLISLQSTVSPTGFLRFITHVQSEKRRMKVAVSSQ